LSSNPFLKFTIKPEKVSDRENFEVQTHLVGNYNHENAMAAVCAGLHFGIPVTDIINAMNEYIPVNFRSQFKKTGNNQYLLDFYNANPSSMEMALKNFKKLRIRGLKKVVVLGEMLELGNESVKEHLHVLRLLKSSGFKEVYLVGKGFDLDLPGKFRYFETSELLKEYFAKNQMSNSLILIKGSRGVKLEKILENF
jgi:UDP-N-acetylmuramoyl-tripeptide--D-alanyl-D-alanine ligase